MASFLTEHHKSIAALNFGVWVGWMALTWRFHTIEAIGAPLFWSAPIISSAVVWVAVVAWARRGVLIRNRFGAALAGVLATALGCPVAIATGVLMAFGAFFPLMFVCLMLEILLLWIAWAAVLALVGVAIGFLDPSRQARSSTIPGA